MTIDVRVPSNLSDWGPNPPQPCSVYQEAETRSATSRSFVFLGHVFDDVREPIYVDVFQLDT